MNAFNYQLRALNRQEEQYGSANVNSGIYYMKNIVNGVNNWHELYVLKIERVMNYSTG